MEGRIIETFPSFLAHVDMTASANNVARLVGGFSTK